MRTAPQRAVDLLMLKLCLPGRPQRNAGILLLDHETGDLYLRIREDWEQIADPEDIEVLSGLSGQFQKQLDELGSGCGAEFLRQLEDLLSNVLRLSQRERITVTDLGSTLDHLFKDNCVS